MLYNSRAVPLLGYLSQLVHLPKVFKSVERMSVLHILHMATNSTDSASLFNLGRLGGPHVKGIAAFAAGSMWRAAWKTVTGWDSHAHALDVSFEEFSTLVNYHAGRASPHWWPEPAFALNLRDAYNDFNSFRTTIPAMRYGATVARREVRKQSRSGLGDIKFQSICTRCIASYSYPNQLDRLCTKRLCSLLPDVA